MSTLSVSIIALIAFVVGAVVLFNLWQARGHRGLAHRDRGDPAHNYESRPGEPRREGAGRDAGGRPGVRRWQPGNDQNAWARQRREPTLTADDEGQPAARFTADSFDAPDQPPGMVERGRRMSADDGVRDDEYQLDSDDDLGPPEFEAPRLDPVPPEPAAPPPPPYEAPGPRGAPFENTQPFRAGPTGPAASAASPVSAMPARGAAVAVNPAAVEALAGAKSPPPRVAGEGDAVAGGDAAGDAGDGGGVSGGGAAAVADEPVFVPADVDQVVTLIPRNPVNAERLIALTSSLRHVGSKSIRIEIDSGQGRWVPLQSGTMVGCLRCSVLLANRQGPLNAVELSDFSAAIESLAGQIGARFVAPDMNQVLRQARELDAVAARLDTQVDLGVEAAEPVTPHRLASVARKLDLFDRGGGRFACYGEGGELLYSLMAGETADMLAFVLDVPRTAEVHDPWRSMVACASRCAQLVGGRVVDSAGRGMSVGMIDSVGLQIHQRYLELAGVGLKAGAPVTLRVFN